MLVNEFMKVSQNAILKFIIFELSKPWLALGMFNSWFTDNIYVFKTIKG